MPRDALVDVAVDRDTGRRTLVAKRRFEAGEVLATDAPLLVWNDPPEGAEASLLKAFLGSAQQDAILALYAPALDRQDEKIDERQKKANSLARVKAFADLGRDTILKVLLIGDAFAQESVSLRDGLGPEARLCAELSLPVFTGRDDTSHGHAPCAGGRDPELLLFGRAVGFVDERTAFSIAGELPVLLRVSEV